MRRTIEIKSLKNIGSLEFEIPDPGVYLLAGKNGSGKTSLLACLRRIGYPNAFPQHFITSSQSKSLDEFGNAKITYTLGDKSVAYSYGGERWTPKPRSQSKLLNEFGYPNVL